MINLCVLSFFEEKTVLKGCNDNAIFLFHSPWQWSYQSDQYGCYGTIGENGALLHWSCKNLTSQSTGLFLFCVVIILIAYFKSILYSWLVWNLQFFSQNISSNSLYWALSSFHWTIIGMYCICIYICFNLDFRQEYCEISINFIISLCWIGSG